MCGIVGAFALNFQPISLQLVQTMNSCITHRGPDEAGIWVQNGVGLAMRRLAIIDLKSGQQPISNEDETVHIVFNGEIYNFPELHIELEAKGHTFRTHSDTETIVHAYEEWGEDCPQHLRGMFAFAIYDARDNSLFLARDRVGKKPLLYTQAGGKFLFASEFPALLSCGDVERKPNLVAIEQYLTTSCIAAPLTGFEGIYKLPPAHSLRLKDGEIQLRRYWDLAPFFEPSRKIQISLEEATQELLARLEEAVKIRLMSEVPLGAFLSGGIDSSAIVALMSRLSSSPVKTFSIGFAEADYSEVEHARRVAHLYGTDHTEIIVEPNALDILPTLVRHYGEPYADSSAVPTFYVSQATRKHVTVALNGDGGDELFGGYERYRRMQMTSRVPDAVLGIGARAASLIPRNNDFRSKTARARRLLEAASLPTAQRYLRWTSAFSAAQRENLYTPEFKAATGFPNSIHPVQQSLEDHRNLEILDRCLLCDSTHYLPDDLLVKVDITSMANSLEARSPFMDHPLMEWAATLPPGFKIQGDSTKHILRQALAQLVPIENMARPKMGFGMPVGRWFQGPLKQLLCDTLFGERAQSRGYFRPEVVRSLVQEHLDSKADHTHRLWALLMLELWHHEFVD